MWRELFEACGIDAAAVYTSCHTDCEYDAVASTTVIPKHYFHMVEPAVNISKDLCSVRATENVSKQKAHCHTKVAVTKHWAGYGYCYNYMPGFRISGR